METGLEHSLGAKVPVLVRSKRELDVVMKMNPFFLRGDEITTLHVTFMGEVPAPADVKAARAKAVDADELQVIRREVYLHCPNGYGNTKLTNAFFEKKFGSEATTRNWKTVTTLAEMAQR
jgi:uncharacterized protein (DUF1697 family)